MEKLIKAIFVITLTFGLVTLLKDNLNYRERGFCVQQQRAIIEREKAGMRLSVVMVVPQCDPSGNFLPQQCEGSAQMCWCVDALGRPLSGTQTPMAQGQPTACPLNWFGQALLSWQMRIQRADFTPSSKTVKPKSTSKVAVIQ